MTMNLETLPVLAKRRPDILLGEFLEDMRSWLDNRRIETVGFDILNGQCEVRFRTPEDARRFERRFD
jgi:hypothetical protein